MHIWVESGQVNHHHNGCFCFSLFLSQFAEDLFALLPELRAEAAVDEDVGGRVDGEEEVADADHDARPQREALEPVRLAFHCVPERMAGRICRASLIRSYP